MRPQLLRALQRIPLGFASPEGASAVRALSNHTLFQDVPSVVTTLSGRKEQGGNGSAFGSTHRPFLGFAAHMSSMSNTDEQQQEQSLPSGLTAVRETLGIVTPPAALQQLPVNRSFATSAAGSHSIAHPTPQDLALGTKLPLAAAPDTARFHPFHIVPSTWWPALTGWCLGNCIAAFTAFSHGVPYSFPVLASQLVLLSHLLLNWWRDCIIESDMGMHTEIVKRNLMYGVWLFIVCEAWLFFGLLWACIHMGVSPNVFVHMQWPPVGIEAVGWDKRALVMSVVLAASYYSANVALVAKDPKMVKAALLTTILLGCLFVGDQYIEYNELPFTIGDSTYGNTFYLTTGFHGMHVLVGAIWLAVALAVYSRTQQAGVLMRSSVLYWHFVDIVWIAVYGIIYVGQY